jgi:dihydroorotate dehydrogenase
MNQARLARASRPSPRPKAVWGGSVNQVGLPNREIYNIIKTMKKTAREILKEIQKLKTNDKTKVSETFVLIEATKKLAELLVILAEEKDGHSCHEH